MTKKELLEKMKNREVFGWVNITSDDGCYVKLVKSQLIQSLMLYSEDSDIQARIQDNDIYIN